MGVRVGTDLVFVPRLAASLARPGLVDRVFTQQEQAYCVGRPASFAGRWAAKEAAMKALGRGLGEVPMLDIEVVSQPSGAPRLVLRGRAQSLARELGWSDVAVSISHDADYAIAVVVATSDVP